MTLVVSVAFWSIRAKPPSPKSTRFHALPETSNWLVPLSWVPPIVKLGSVGCSDRPLNCVALNVALFRLDQVVPPSIDFQMPPSSPR